LCVHVCTTNSKESALAAHGAAGNPKRHMECTQTPAHKQPNHQICAQARTKCHTGKKSSIAAAHTKCAGNKMRTRIIPTSRVQSQLPISQMSSLRIQALTQAPTSQDMQQRGTQSTAPPPDTRNPGCSPSKLTMSVAMVATDGVAA
jgi:hypothetical protein